MLTTLVTILFLATACTEEPAPAPDTKETDRLSRQIQQLQAENEAFRNELATLTAEGTEQQKTPATETTVTENFTPTPDEPKAKPSRPTENICSRSPDAQKLLRDEVNLSRCAIITGEELFRIEEIDYRGTLWAGDLNDLVNLKELELEYLDVPLPENVLADLVNLENLDVDINLENPDLKSKADEPWALEGMFTGTPNLKVLKIDGPNVNLIKEALQGLRELEEVSISQISFLASDTFSGLTSLKKVELRGEFTKEQIEVREFVFPANMIRDNPGVEHWDIRNFAFPRVIPYASLEQFCRIGKIAGGNEDTEYQFNGEKIVRVSKDNGVCRIGTGEPDSNGNYPESEVKIVDGRPQATP